MIYSIKRSCVALFGIILVVSILPASHGTTDLVQLLGKLLGAPSQESYDNRWHEAEKAWLDQRQQIEDFSQRKDTIPVAEAAAEWLGYFDVIYSAQSASMEYRYLYNAFEVLINALPGPDAWPELSRLVAERPVQTGALALREDLLRMMVCRLTGDYSGLRDRLERILSEFNDLPSYRRPDVQQSVGEAYMEIQPRVSRFLGLEAEGFGELVEMLAASKIQLDEWDNDLSIPDLVGLVGEAKAQELILKALALPGVSLEVPCGGRTLELAKRLALEGIDMPGAPQWGLVTSPDDAELFEKMSVRFPLKDAAPAPQSSFFFDREDFSDSLDYRRESAMSLYVEGLILRQELDKAVDYVAGLGPGVLREFDDLDQLVGDVPASGYPNLIKFYDALLERSPKAPVRNGLATCILLVGDTERAVSDLRKKLSVSGLQPDEQIDMQLELAMIYFALDQVDSGLAIYRELLAVDPSGKSLEILDKLIDVGETTIELGNLLKNEELVEDGIKSMTAAGREKDRNNNSERISPYGWRHNLAARLIDMRRFPEAESLCNETLAAAIKQQQARSGPGSRRVYYSSSGQSAMLSQLLTIYNETGRFDKSVDLLETSPLWGQKDLVGFVYESPDMLFLSARALHEMGRDDESMFILRVFLFKTPDYDPAYRLLLDMQGEAALPLLDEIYGRDRFEERPLIWKAQLLEELGRLEEAEETIRLALKVDPTDGEQRAGDRVRAYAVMSDILAARGNAEDATFFADVVKSVRVAEQGDACYRAGLILRGLSLYEQAEMLFADAYCIQWRLAERLYSMGRTEEARAHYEVAFRRLPEQFGRVASFCFGCEGVFATEHTRTIAEGILVDLKETSPERPQLYYLMGKLRERQDRHAEAYEELLHAVELDPDYLDAWDMLSDLSDQVNIPQSERDAIQLRIHSLDPLQRHTRMNESNFADLSVLWKALKESEKYGVEIPDSLMPLPASAEYLERLDDDTRRLYGNTFYDDDGNTPEDALADDDIIGSIGELLNTVIGY